MSSGALRQPAWMRFAWAELGQREIPGPASNPRIADYIRRVGHPSLAHDATAWCAAFVGACLDRAGEPGTGSLMARSYLRWGVAAEPGTLGAVAVLSRGADPALGHVGFLVGTTESALYLLGGNQSDAVNVARFDRSRLLGLRVPASRAERPGAGPPVASPLLPDFAWSLSRILVFEGGWSDDAFDPGGPTNKGITLAVFARASGAELTPETTEALKASLRAIPDSQVERIYRERYWRPARCPDLPPPLAHFHFDTAVNQGVAGSARMLQEALGVDIDGAIGPRTLAAAHARLVTETLDRYAAIRRRRYRSLAHFWRFGRGWLVRVDKALSEARDLAGPPRVPAGPPQASTRPPDAASPASPPEAPSPKGPSTMTVTKTHTPSAPKWWGESLTIWGALLTAATTVAPAIFAAFGLDVSPELAERLGRDTLAAVQALGGLSGTLMTILGRARAATPLERRALSIRL